MADYSTRRGGLRAKLPVQVLKGFYPTEPNKLSSLAEPLSVSTIKSGMAIVKNGAGKWIPATAAEANFASGATPVSIFIALTDADALDVQASGKLVGLDCSDKFELQTGYFDQAQVWAVGDKITVGAAGIFVKAAQHATLNTQYIGEITEIGTVDTTFAIPYVGFTPSCAAADATLIQFKTVSGVIIPTTLNVDDVV